MPRVVGDAHPTDGRTYNVSFTVVFRPVPGLTLSCPQTGDGPRNI